MDDIHSLSEEDIKLQMLHYALKDCKPRYARMCYMNKAYNINVIGIGI